MSIVGMAEALLELGLSSSVTDEERAVVASAIQRAEGAVRRHLQYDPAYAERTEFYPQARRAGAVADAMWEVSGNQAVLREVPESASAELQVQHVPIRSIVSLRIDYGARGGSVAGSFGLSTEKREGVDYWPNYDGEDEDGNKFCRDGIIRNSGGWPVAPGTVRLVYAAGYKAAEFRGCGSLDGSPIWEVVLNEAIRRTRAMFTSKKHVAIGLPAGTITSERLGDYSYSVDPGSAGQLTGRGDLTMDSMSRLNNFINYGWSTS